MGPVVTALLQAVPQIVSIATGQQASPAAQATVAANKGSDQPADPASLRLIGKFIWESRADGKPVEKEELEKYMEGKPGLKKAYKQLIDNGTLSIMNNHLVVWNGDPSYETDERMASGETDAEGKSSSATFTSTRHQASKKDYDAAFEKDFGFKPIQEG